MNKSLNFSLASLVKIVSLFWGFDLIQKNFSNMQWSCVSLYQEIKKKKKGVRTLKAPTHTPLSQQTLIKYLLL